MKAYNYDANQNQNNVDDPDFNPDQPPEDFGPPIRRMTSKISYEAPKVTNSHDAFWKQKWSDDWSSLEYSRRVLAINGT